MYDDDNAVLHGGTVPYSYSPSRDSIINRRILHQQRVAAQEAVSPTAVQNAKFTIDDSYLQGLLVARLTGIVLTDQICSRRVTAIFDVPASWWQHFKQDVLPKRLTDSKWFRKHMPVRLKQMEQLVVFDESRMYPDYSFALPDQFGQPVIVETITKTPWKESNV